MRSKDKLLFIGVSLIAAIVSLFISNALFGSPAKHNSQAPIVESISTAFPDVKNDPDYSGFINNKALDPTQPVQIGNSQNATPFR